MKTIKPEYTYQDIANEFKITRQGAQHIERKALIKLHNLIKERGITWLGYDNEEPRNDCIRKKPHFDYDGENTLCYED